MKTITVIIPTLNEEDNIGGLLSYLRQLDNSLELIVSDGGSNDETVAIAKKYAVVIKAVRGRGVQMNAGAKKATGEILWFLHADCLPHPDSVRSIKSVIDKTKVVGGGFKYRFNHPGIHFRLSETFSNFKNYFLNWIFGDMGMFVLKTTFEQMNGFSEIPLMEDVEFSGRLKKSGKVVFLSQRMKTSARRWLEKGFIRNTIKCWFLQIAWVLGISPFTLAKWYRFK